MKAMNILRGALLAALLLVPMSVRATVSTITNYVVAGGNGVTMIFNYGFPIPQASDAVVIHTTAAGVVTTLSQSQYSITGIGLGAGGQVLYPLVGSAMPSGDTLTIERVVPLTQPTSFGNQGTIYPAAIEGGLDNLEMQLQQIAASQGKTIQFPLVDAAGLNATLPAAAARAGLYLCFDALGQVTVCAGGGGGGGSGVNPGTMGQLGYYASAGSVLSGASLTTLIDAAFGTSQGSILYRDAANWNLLGPGAAGLFLQTQGASANPLWAAAGGSGNVNSGSAGQLAYYGASGTTISGNTMSALIDASIGATQGGVLYRGASTWNLLGPGVSGQFLKSAGAAANPLWASGAGITNVTIQSFASSGTYTPTAGTRFVLVYGWGAGAGSAGSGTGGNGGQTSMGSLLVAKGGTGGTTTTGGPGGTGGTTSAGGTLVNGQAGGTPSSFTDGGNQVDWTAGYGGGSPGMSPAQNIAIEVTTCIAGALPGQAGSGVATGSPSGTGGGGGGEEAIGVFTAASIGASQSVTIGPAGTAGTGGGCAGFKGYLYVVEFQ